MNLSEIDGSNWTILIVDDEPDNLGVAEQLLKFTGAAVYTACNGKEGLEVLEKMEQPSFILLDLSMPEMDGWEMLEEMRKMNGFAGVPVIALTAHAMDGDAEAAFEAGFNGYIMKPVLLEPFFDEIYRVLDENGKE